MLKVKQFKLIWVDRYSHVQNTTHKEGLTNLQGLLDLDSDVAEQLTMRMNNIFGDDFFADRPTAKTKKTKTKYTCLHCKLNVWGKPGLSLRCEECDFVLIG